MHTHVFEEVIRIRDRILDIASKDGFALRQWTSNEESLISDFVNYSANTYIRLNVEEITFTLGEWRYKARIQGLHYTACTEQIKQKLHLHEHIALHVSNVICQQFLLMFSVELQPPKYNKQIFNITKLLHINNINRIT
ncbi:hypothetical protein V1477_019463 [Vespula maculifrons]|uniref:Pre-C2HC domain-containing protein n=1 Tax=Vespula maculifrons TaxID=7453 RepID=A0ABD2ASK9_VESMC